MSRLRHAAAVRAGRTQVKSIQGEPGLMPVREVMQWAETYGKSGTLHISRAGVELIYLANGLLNRPERLPELQRACRHLDLGPIDFAYVEQELPAIAESAAGII